MKSLNKISPVWLFCYSVLTVSTALADVLENPQPGSAQSGISLISGWVCNASHVYVVIDGSQTYTMAYGTERTDTLSVCGDTNNGFGFLFNYNKLGDGQHTLQALADGVEFGQATFTVTTLGQEYLEGASRTFELPDFPNPGTTLTLVWQEHLQNFTIAGKNSGTSSLAPGAWTGEDVCFNVSPDGSKLTAEDSLCTITGEVAGTAHNGFVVEPVSISSGKDGYGARGQYTDIPIVNGAFDLSWIRGIFNSATTASGSATVHNTSYQWNASRNLTDIRATPGKWSGSTSKGGKVCFYVSSDSSQVIKGTCFGEIECAFVATFPGEIGCQPYELQIVNNSFSLQGAIKGKFISKSSASGTVIQVGTSNSPISWTANPGY